MKILNLYAGIGGNRKLWGDENQITAVEIEPEIAKVYQDYFPKDKMIIGDAHKYLEEHFREFDFIWSSPPCQSHSRARYPFANNEYIETKPIYIDMKLWQEIQFLKMYYKGLWVVENVVPYYKPFFRPTIRLERHYYWSNFPIWQGRFTPKNSNDETRLNIPKLEKLLGYNLSKYKLKNKKQILRNCIIPEQGLHILECAMEKTKTLF